MKQNNKIVLAVAGFAAAISLGAVVTPQPIAHTASAVVQMIVPAQKVEAATEPTTPAIDKTYTFGVGMGSSLKTAHRYIILHDVGTESGAWENAHYFYNNWASSQTYVQYVVGDGGHIYQLGAPGYQAWGAGSYANANAPVQIELAHTTNAATFAKDYAAYVNLARFYAKQYGIPLTLDGAGNGIKSHLWVTQNFWGDHTDPFAYLLRFGVTKAKLAADLANGIGGAPVSPPTTSRATTTPAARTSAAVNVTYALHVLGGSWLDNVTNVGSGPNGFAGLPNHEHDLLTANVSHGTLTYRVHTDESGWLPPVSIGNRTDTVHGCAGIVGQAIDGVQMVYTTPTGESYKQAYYRSQTVDRGGWLDACADDGSVAGFDAWAGMTGEPLDRLQLQVDVTSPY